MLLHQVIEVSSLIFKEEQISLNQINLIRGSCSEFITNSNGFPVLKRLKKESTFNKIKIRFKSGTRNIIDLFNSVFEEKLKIKNIFQRSLITNNILSEEDEGEDFFIFVPNNFQFLYNSEISNFLKDHNIIDKILKETDDQNIKKLVLEMFDSKYTNENLHEALKDKCEILFFNIPYFFAVKASSIEYQKLYSKLS